MARYPGARWRPVTRYQPGGHSCVPMDRWDAGVDHTYVGGSKDSAFNHFNVDGTPIPHFMVFRDGSIEQYVDTAYRSSACLEGNPRVIAWETADGYPSLWTTVVKLVGLQSPRDNRRMVRAKAELMVWLNKTHGIPLKRMPDSRPGSRGMGWHRLGIDGNYETPPGTLLGGRVNGGELWSPSRGKTCPTSRRIRQYVKQTIPAARELANPTPKITRAPRHRVFHVHKGAYYYTEDSFRGLRFAIAKQFGWIDFDVHKTKDGVLICAHGPRPLAKNTRGGFHDSEADTATDPIPRDATYEELTWAQVQRLRSNDGKGYRVSRADVLIPAAIRKGVGVELEGKTPKITADDLRALLAKVSDPDKLWVKAFPRFLPVLKAARDAGVKVRVVLSHHGEKIPASAVNYVTHFRGKKPQLVKTS